MDRREESPIGIDEDPTANARVEAAHDNLEHGTLDLIRRG
jgi:hypothetical protein